MELTTEFLKNNGYTTNHPGKTLPTYYKTNNNPQWRIEVEQHFSPHVGAIMFDVFCSRMNDNGFLVKQTIIQNAVSVEELNDCITLCGIEQ